MTPFIPHPRLLNGHTMTVFAWGHPRHFPRLPPAETRYFDVAPRARVMARCHWQRERWRHPTLVALHGLEGSSDTHYMRGIADKAFARGFNVVRLNQRNCGGTEALSEGLYHSGLTGDPAFVLRELTDVDGLGSMVVAGYSLGGNLALKLAGDYADSPPPGLAAVCAVSPTLELARCVDALERRHNVLYEWNFLRNLKRRMRRKAELFPEHYPLDRLRGLRRVRQFDEAVTAPHFGFRDAADYYHRASSLRVVSHIRVPALVITAEDDPFVPPEQFQAPELAANPFVTLIVTPHGGHCAFVSARQGNFDGYWAEQAIVDFASKHVRTWGDGGTRELGDWEVLA